MNSQTPVQFVNSDNGQNRRLLSYEAKITDIIKGPLTTMSSSISDIFQFMNLKAQTPEDRLLIKTLFSKILLEHLTTAGGLMMVLDDKVDINAIFEKAIKDAFKKNSANS